MRTAPRSTRFASERHTKTGGGSAPPTSPPLGDSMRRQRRPLIRVRPVAAAVEQAMTRRVFLAGVGAGGTLLLLSGFPETATAAGHVGPAKPGDSVVVQWNAAFLQGARDSKPGPPMCARALAIGHTCIYDAGAAYDRKAVGTP